MAAKKRRISYEQPGHSHELTFSCYRRLPLLADAHAKDVFLSRLQQASQTADFKVTAFVIMPEHVHLLIRPNREDYRVAEILRSIKQPIAQDLIKRARADPIAMSRLQVPKRNGAIEYRFWQAGGGYDRNLWTPKHLRSSIEYIHQNPVRRGLTESPWDYPWSSAAAYHQGEDPTGLVSLYSEWA